MTAPDHFDEMPAPPMPEVPPANIFRVRRFDENMVIEEIVVAAHTVEMNDAGNILRFMEFYIAPGIGGARRIVRCFNGWEDFSEDAPPEPSRILAVDFGATPPARYN